MDSRAVRKFEHVQASLTAAASAIDDVRREAVNVTAALVGELESSERLIAHLVSMELPRRCELVGHDDRCEDAAVAVRWEDGFADFVCESHAANAVERGMRVVRGRRHDGTESVAVRGE